MSASRLLVSPLARADLAEIYRFGLIHWGQARANQYLDQIKAQFWALTAQPLLGMERSELSPGMRSIPLVSHVVYYRTQPGRIEIVRVLHARQDTTRQQSALFQSS